ncbi:MAG: hypothetical protein KGL39_30830 [Patescibacteria group bacterium]|nr:hypothetical protein [Patescibacteria group bacterium]
MPFDRSEAIRAVLLAIAGALAILAVTLCIPEARAAWRAGSASPEMQAWFKNQHNQHGQWCCDSADGHPFYGPYKINADGSVTLIADEGPHKMPPYMVLKGPNPTGHAVWWFVDVGGEHRDYCFAPGTLT